MEKVLTFRITNLPDYRRVALQTFRITIGLLSFFKTFRVALLPGYPGFSDSVSSLAQPGFSRNFHNRLISDTWVHWSVCPSINLSVCPSVSLSVSWSIGGQPVSPMVDQSVLNFIIAKLSPSPSLRLRWLYFQMSLPPTQPPIRTSLNLASDNITVKSKVACLYELGL